MPRDNLADSSRTMNNQGRCAVSVAHKIKKHIGPIDPHALEKSPPEGRNLLPFGETLHLIFTLNQNRFTDYQPPANVTFHEQRFRELTVLFGGKAAESIIGKRETSRAFSGDEKEIRVKPREPSALSGSFSEHKTLSHCEKHAREIVEANTLTIRRLAKLLTKRGEVRGKELNKRFYDIVKDHALSPASSSSYAGSTRAPAAP